MQPFPHIGLFWSCDINLHSLAATTASAL